MIARLYRKLVPALQLHLSKKFSDRNDKVQVLVSNTGVDKDGYASPIANYLTANGVSKTFLDRTSLRPGTAPGNEMLWAATSCRHMWRAPPRDFVQKWSPLRELFTSD